MAIGRTNAGGGASLNFKVVGGTTAPGSPTENTIWVNTSTAIPSWAFSATEPGSPAAGMVWISTGTSSTVAFNALKKNAIQVYPARAKQYVGGKWVAVDAYIYKSGTWVQFSSEITYYRLPGDECSAITGGWEAKGASTKKSTDSGFTAPTVTDLEDAVKVWLDGQFWTGSANQTRSGGYFTKNKIDFSGISAIKINVTQDYRGSSDHPGAVVFGIASSTSSPLPSLASCTISGAKEYTIDTENVEQECYIYLVEEDASRETYIEFSEIFS